MHIRRILAVALAHFAIAMLVATVAFGADMDQLRSRSWWSGVAAAVHDVLWFAHDVALRAVPNASLVRNRWVIPAMLVLNSLAWGASIYLLLRVLGWWRDGEPRGPN